MHPFVQLIAFYGFANALVAFACASRYRLHIQRRNAFEAAPENHWVRWRIPKDRKDLTLFQAFLNCYMLLWMCTLMLFMCSMIHALMKATAQ